MEKTDMKPKEIRESLKNNLESLMAGPSYSLMLTVTEGNELAITGGAIDMVPDYRQLGRALYKALTEREDYGNAFALILQGMDEVMEREGMYAHLVKAASHGSGAAS